MHLCFPFKEQAELVLKTKLQGIRAPEKYSLCDFIKLGSLLTTPDKIGLQFLRKKEK